MTRSAQILVTALAMAACVGHVQAECDVWTVAQTERVLRDAPAGSDTSAKIAAARNEWESFQILLRSDAAVDGINIEAGDLAGPGDAVIPASQARLFRQHQFELTVPTVRNDNPKYMYNGEGSLLYPARAVGYEGIASSLRLKALRDSIEDYEYLAILERAGLDEQAQEVVVELADSWFEWEAEPGAYEKARGRLAEMIVSEMMAE